MTSSLPERLAAADRIAREVTAPAAADVDRDGRFPVETIEALRGEGLLSLPVPAAFGGPGASLGELLDVIRTLAAQDASVGLILCMHYSQIVVLARHATTLAHEQLLTEIHEQQLLIANSNSEMNIGSTDRRSTCALRPAADGGATLAKDTPVISYGEYADAIFITARRTVDSPGNDQVMALCRRANIDLRPLGPWDALGLRGTCSRPFHLEATVEPDMWLSDYAHIVAQTGMPVNNLMFAAMWLGMAESAVATAHRFARKRYRGRAEEAAVPLLRLAELAAQLQQMRSLVSATRDRFTEIDGTDAVQRLDAVNDLQALKVNASTMCAALVQRAMLLCGVAGYLNTGDFSLARQLRDALGAVLMINNDAMLGQNGMSLLLLKQV